MLAQSIVGTKKRSFFIEGFSKVTDQDAWNVDRIATKKNGRGSIDSQVTSSAMGFSKTSVGVRTSISLSLHEVTTTEIKLELVGFATEFQHHVVNLARLSMANT